MTLEDFSNKLYESKILHDYKDGKIDYRKVHDWIVSQEEAITVTHCCKSDSEQCCGPVGEGFYLGTSCPKCKQPFRQNLK